MLLWKSKPDYPWCSITFQMESSTTPPARLWALVMIEKLLNWKNQFIPLLFIYFHLIIVFNIVFTHCIFQPCYKRAQWFCVWGWEWGGKRRRWLHGVWMSWTGFSKYCDMNNQFRLNFEQTSTDSFRMILFDSLHCITTS